MFYDVSAMLTKSTRKNHNNNSALRIKMRVKNRDRNSKKEKVLI